MKEQLLQTNQNFAPQSDPLSPQGQSSSSRQAKHTNPLQKPPKPKTLRMPGQQNKQPISSTQQQFNPSSQANSARPSSITAKKPTRVSDIEEETSTTEMTPRNEREAYLLKQKQRMKSQAERRRQLQQQEDQKKQTIQDKIENARRRKEAERNRLLELKKSKRSSSTQGRFFQPGMNKDLEEFQLTKDTDDEPRIVKTGKQTSKPFFSRRLRNSSQSYGAGKMNDRADGTKIGTGTSNL